MSLHPFIQQLLEQMAGRPALADCTPEQGRAMVAATRPALGKGPEMRQVTDFDLPTRQGSIRARLMIPGPDPIGLVVYLHGGGWVLGQIDDFDTLGRELAARSGCAVLIPDYRLAPEFPFPAGLDDVVDVLLWVQSGKAPIAEWPLPLIMAGDSAGGNLATVAARQMRGKVDIAAQVLIYPVTDARFDRASYRDHGSGLPLTARDMVWFFNHYAPLDQRHQPEISPLRAEDLSALPPAMVTVAEYDVLADDGLEYARRLQEAGVETELRRVGGVTHGFIRLHNLFDVARDEVEVIAAFCAKHAERATMKKGSHK